MEASDPELHEAAQIVLHKYRLVRDNAKFAQFTSPADILRLATILVAAESGVLVLNDADRADIFGLVDGIRAMSTAGGDLGSILLWDADQTELVTRLSTRATAELVVYIASLFDEASDFAERRRGFEETLVAAIALEARIRTSTSDVEAATASLSKELGDYVTLKEGSAFISRANAYAVASTIWLIGAGVLAAAITWSAWWVMWNTLWHKIPVPLTVLEAYSVLGAKAAFFGLLLLGVTVCTRNYAANRHNQVVNLHRADALTSYRALVAAAGSDASRDIILSQAAAAIFANQDSGFVKTANGSDTPTVVNTIAESLRPKAD